MNDEGVLLSSLSFAVQQPHSLAKKCVPRGGEIFCTVLPRMPSEARTSTSDSFMDQFYWRARKDSNLQPPNSSSGSPKAGTRALTLILGQKLGQE